MPAGQQDTENEESGGEDGPSTPLDRQPIPFSEFLERVPPCEPTKVSDLATLRRLDSGTYTVISTPEIQMHCTDDACNGTRFFRFLGEPTRIKEGDEANVFFEYRCSNCRRTSKLFALFVKWIDRDANDSLCYKYGELPPYGPPVPGRLISLIGPDRDIFLKGRQCENQGLGIGAFGYYRRVVENQKNRILKRILKVLEKIHAPSTMMDALSSAIAETQFTKAIDAVRDAIPQVLLINGQNPLTLLHSALSRGLHSESDAVCLELAHDVRVILAELSERLARALKDEAEVNAAITRLLNAKQPKA